MRLCTRPFLARADTARAGYEIETTDRSTYIYIYVHIKGGGSIFVVVRQRETNFQI